MVKMKLFGGILIVFFGRFSIVFEVITSQFILFSFSVLFVDPSESQICPNTVTSTTTLTPLTVTRTVTSNVNVVQTSTVTSSFSLLFTITSSLTSVRTTTVTSTVPAAVISTTLTENLPQATVTQTLPGITSVLTITETVQSSQTDFAVVTQPSSTLFTTTHPVPPLTHIITKIVTTSTKTLHPTSTVHLTVSMPEETATSCLTNSLPKTPFFKPVNLVFNGE
jgi:hypothetical protein